MGVMSDGKPALTEDEKKQRAILIGKRIQDHFNKFVASDAKCSVCGEKTWRPINDGPENGFALFGEEVFGQRYMPLVGVRCATCDQVLLFSAVRILGGEPS